ncbi:epithelial cell transforming 2 like [Phyllostomus discolor]|uniref:Epithelial cell transforming 2 like n=1 Tax=Phyllostomus discolor TaxID=89673 RepID=A0A834AMQ4_9CHIR|nr:epithelial cell transforming 2 like [Phyllostomus discolor]
MLSLPELLLYPSQRFEEYIHLLHALRLHTPAEHVDRGDLTTAIDQIKTYKGYIDQMRQNINTEDQLSDIQRSIWGCPVCIPDVLSTSWAHEKLSCHWQRETPRCQIS